MANTLTNPLFCILLIYINNGVEKLLQNSNCKYSFFYKNKNKMKLF